MENLKKMYPAIIAHLRAGYRTEWTRQEMLDAFAWLYGVTNAKTAEAHIARMTRLGLIEWDHNAVKPMFKWCGGADRA